MEREVLLKVSETISAIDKAEGAEDVVIALHSLALRLFLVDTVALLGVVSDRYKQQLDKVETPSDDKRHEWWEAFYSGVAFPVLARVLLHDVSASWLSRIPHSARVIVYDVYFICGTPAKVIQVMVPCLDHKGQDDHVTKAVRSNAERLLELCLLENESLEKIARDFSCSPPSRELPCSSVKDDISRVAQLVASIPDKTRLRAPKCLSSHSFFKHVIIQLLKAAEERTRNLVDSATVYEKDDIDGTFQFVGEMFARLCRRGSADIVADVVIPQALEHIKRFLILDKDVIREDALLSDQQFTFWFQMIKAVKDPHAVEMLAERILRRLANEHVRDLEAYWILWVLFSQSCDQPSLRVLFHEKFLLWKVFPLCCLRWILQFAILECPPIDGQLTKGKKNSHLLDIVRCLSAMWSKQEFIRSTPTEQQIYITSTLGLLMEKMSREELDSTKDVMQSVLEGVRCRLESPSDLIRRTASTIALVFSKVVDPENPLYLDDRYKDSDIDWEFGAITQNKDEVVSRDATVIAKVDIVAHSTEAMGKQHDDIGKDEGASKAEAKRKKSSQLKLVDPDEIIDLADMNDDEATVDAEEDGTESEFSEASSDSSLEPYDMTDDDSDLNKRFTQLEGLVTALRKTDDPDGVERALGIAENLVRASPDELLHVAGELVRTLVQVRCSDFTVEGDEDFAEEKRHNALVSLLVTCPFESVDSINKLLYSPHVDVGQRIMMLDSMMDAAHELAFNKVIKQKHQSRPLISTTNEIEPWFLPSSKGPFRAGPWKEIADVETPLNWSYRYERELPSRSVPTGKARRWSNRQINVGVNETELSANRFPLYAAAFMLPAMQGFDKRRHGVDLLGSDYIVLGKLIYMLGVCMKCAALHPEASALATPFLDMLSTREVYQHKEAYVRRSVLFAASCTLTALHPSYVATAVTEGNQELSRGLDWIRTWALQVSESDPDRECYTMAMACLQLHAQMSLQAARALESVESSFKTKTIELPSSSLKGVIKIPNSRNFS